MSTQMHRRALKLHQPSTNRLLQGQSFYKKGSGSEFPLVRPTSPLTVGTLGSCFPHKKHFSEHWEEKMNHNYEPRTLRTLVFYSTKSLMTPKEKSITFIYIKNALFLAMFCFFFSNDKIKDN